MAIYYQVWDDETGNRVGGSFATEVEARELLMAVLVFRRNAQGRYEPETVLDGGDLLSSLPGIELSA
jgi:hypothetical protein